MPKRLLLFFALSLGVFSACPENSDGTADNEPQVTEDEETSCSFDEQCFNGQTCYEGDCIDDDLVPVAVLDAGSLPPTNSSAIEVVFLAPADRSTAYAYEAVELSGTVLVVDGDAEGLVVSFTSSLDGALETAYDADNGEASATVALSPGTHTLTLTGSRGAENTSATVSITVCDYLINEDFADALNPDDWKVYGDAQRMADGYLEMTNNQNNRYGKIYYVAQTVNAGSLTAHFKIYTGPNDATGADGFSVTIVDALSVADLEKTLSCMGGIGNAFTLAAETCNSTAEELMTKNTFSIEFDTFANGFFCNTPQNGPTDPTCEDHIAINLNGSAMPYYWLPEGWGDYEDCLEPGESGDGWYDSDGCRAALDCENGTCLPVFPWFDRQVLGYGVPDEDTPRFWAAMGNIEDSQWHDVSVFLTAGQARVTFDDEEIINATVPEFDFKGGYLGFTGGSGGASNYHRFDDVRIEGTCTYAE